MAKKNVLITGATGYIGQVFLQQIDFKKYDVHCLVRSKESDTVLNIKKDFPSLQFIEGDITDQKSLKNIPDDTEILMHIAALTNAPKGIEDTWPLFKKINVDGTSNIIKAMPKKLKQVVFVSSVDAAGSLQVVSQATEEIPTNPNTEYDKSKLAGEKIVAKLAKQQNFAYTIIRPSMVFGPGDSNPEMFKINTLISLYFKLVKLGVFPLFGNGSNMVPLVAVNDVCQLINNSILNKKAYQQVFNAACDNPLNLKQLIKTIKEIANPNCIVIPIPLFLLKTGLSILEFITKPLGISLPLTAQGVTYLTTSRSYDISKAKNLLDYQPTPLKKALQETYNWLTKS
jgi:nucleoside-diphosphate-sugar epimerase